MFLRSSACANNANDSSLGSSIYSSLHGPGSNSRLPVNTSKNTSPAARAPVASAQMTTLTKRTERQSCERSPARVAKFKHFFLSVLQRQSPLQNKSGRKHASQHRIAIFKHALALEVSRLISVVYLLHEEYLMMVLPKTWLLENNRIFLPHRIFFTAAWLPRTRFSALLAHLIPLNKSTLTVHLSSISPSRGLHVPMTLGAQLFGT